MLSVLVAAYSLYLVAFSAKACDSVGLTHNTPTSITAAAWDISLRVPALRMKRTQRVKHVDNLGVPLGVSSELSTGCV